MNEASQKYSKRTIIVFFEACLQNEVSHNRHTLKVFNFTPINPYLGVGVKDPKKLLKITKFAKSFMTTVSLKSYGMEGEVVMGHSVNIM